MQYLGSKRAIAKNILPIILRDRKKGQTYVEPFLGGANTFYQVDGPKIGNDINPYLIALWEGVRSGRSLRDFSYSRERFNLHKERWYNNRSNSLFVTAAYGYIPTYSGLFYDSFCIHNAKGTDYINQRITSIEKQINGMKDAVLYNANYYEIPIPDNSIIYADPPYKNTVQYKGSKNFDSESLYDWLQVLHWLGCRVYLSEYTAPKYFTKIWEKPILSTFGGGSNKLRIERLYTLI
jgi:DNA adenine methylase